MNLSERYIAPPIRVDDIVEDLEWVRTNFRRFIEFFYSEYPSWRYIVTATPETYKSIAKSKGLPVFKVGIVDGEKIKLKKYKTVRIVYIDDSEVAIPMFIIDENDKFIPV